MNGQSQGDPGGGTLVVVVDTPAVRRTVEYAARRHRSTSVHLLALTRDGDRSVRTPPLLRDAADWARRAGTGRSATGDITRSGRSLDGRWPTPEDAASTISAYASERGTDRVLVPADFERAFHGVPAEALVGALREAGVADPAVGPVGRAAIHRRIVGAGTTAAAGALFVLSLAFYLVLAGTVDAFEVVTGVATAAVVAVTFRRVTFETSPRLGRSSRRVGRWCLYVPYLLWEVARANLAIAAIVLHPRLPVDPKLVSYPTALEGELALTTFANSVTLTPGTLTVDVEDGTLLVHTLTETSRTELLEGSLERAVRFVFEGRDGASTDAARPTAGLDVGVSDD